MTLVTTSRRSTPVIRSIAKDLAFATGARYLARGKHGLREIATDHDLFIVFEQQNSEILMTVYGNSEQVLCRIVRSNESDVREGVLFRGIRTSDKELASALKNSCPVQSIDDDSMILIYDGPQRRCIKLSLVPGTLHDA